MDKYKVKIVGHNPIREYWGAFRVIKTFDILESIQNKNNGKLRNIPSNVSGFIVQHVIKETNAFALCKDNIIKKINNIDKFTSNKTLHMNHTYTELFPVIDGKSAYSDLFSNGAILRYEYDSNDNIWYANNNPPTAGHIEQKGLIYFIEAERYDVENVIQYIDNNNNNNSKKTKILALGLEWDISKKTPANGLPYISGEKGFSLLNKKQSNITTHLVTADWDRINIPFNPNHITNNIEYGCNLLNESKIKKERPITKLKSIFF
jgi:hypothetical protein